ITTSALPGGAVGVNYNAGLAAANGVPPYTWGIVGGHLPPGLRLQASSGEISGVPTQAGAFSFQAGVNDSIGATASSSFSINTGTRFAPDVSRVSPNSGPTAGGTPVTISGSNFQTGATVLFGGVTASAVRVSSATQIQVVTPAHIAGTVDVTVSNSDAESSTLTGGFAYGVVWPTVRSVSPNSGSTGGGTSVTITGTNFLAGAIVLFGTVSASVTASTGTQIQAVTPPNAAGVVHVTVEDPGGQSAELAGGFTYVLPQPAGPPTIGGVSPSSGTPGTQVTISGTNFAQGATVEFGGARAASVFFVSTTQLTASVPSIGAGTYNVTVTNPDPASATLPGAFTVTKSKSLLAGATVSATNVPSVAIPSGWTLALAEGFESGKIGPNEFGLCNDPTQCNLTSITGTNAHSGSFSEQCAIPFNGAACTLGVGPGFIGSSNHIYVSYWRYFDQNACGDIEIYFAEVFAGAGGGGAGFADEMDNDNYSTPSNNCVSSMTPRFYGDGAHIFNDGPPQGTDHWNLPLGVWEQVEFEFKGSTCTGSASNNDGLYRLFVNGVLTAQHLNFNTNGCLAGFSSVGMGIRAGGTFTYGSGGLAKGKFNVYIDDVILLKQ
ncbi:MAG: IPT/TIG domain-containing protein, partial [Candidatus Acidiferrales bacterium]